MTGAAAPRVLVAEDEKMVLRLYERALRQKGFAVWQVVSGEAAVELALKNTFDIAVIDLRLKGKLDGLTTYRALKALQPDLRGIIVTGYGSRQHLLEALRLGIDAWLEKPVTVTDLVETVHRVLQTPRSAPLSLMPPVSSQDNNALLRLFLQMLLATTLSDMAVLWVRPLGSQEMVPHIVLGDSGTDHALPSVPYSGDDTWLHQLKTAVDEETGCSCLIAPIKWQGEPLGAIAICRHRLTHVPYNQADLDYLVRFAQWVTPLVVTCLYPIEVLTNLFPLLEAVMGLLHQQVEPMEHQHPRRLRLIARLLGKALGLPPGRLLLLELAATLHDLGKVFVPREVIAKPTALSDLERSLVQKHPIYGEQLVRQSGLPDDIALWVRWHHERYDGMGYPDRRRQHEIPLEAQILAVAEALDTLLSPRPYKPALPFDEALKRLRSERGKQFAPKVIDALDRVADELRRHLTPHNSAPVTAQ